MTIDVETNVLLSDGCKQGAESASGACAEMNLASIATSAFLLSVILAVKHTSGIIRTNGSLGSSMAF